ncbi:ABC transporter ATP-binding protein [Salmonella enterica]|nr:ABC transporter ATP-binding protein [Salmonella enterica]
MSNFIYVVKYTFSRELYLKCLFLLLMTIVGTACYSLIPLLLQKTINALTSGDGIYISVTLMVILYIVHDAISSLSGSYSQVLSVNIGNKLGEKYIYFLGSMPMQFFINMGPAKLTQILQSAKAGLASNLQALTYSILPTIIQLIIAMSVLIHSDDYYVVFSIIIYFILYSLLSYFMVRKISKLYMDTVLTNIENSKTINILVSNIETIKIFNAKNFAIENYNTAQNFLLKKWMRYFLNELTMESIRVTLFAVLMVFVLFLSVHRYVNNEITIGHFVMLNTYIFQICKPFESFVKSVGNIIESIIGMTPLSDILRSDLFKMPFYKADSSSSSSSSSSLVIKNLYFKYGDRESYTLSDLNLDFEKGKKIAIIGPSGTGKTTLLSLLLKLNVPDSGNIYLNGKDIQNYTDDEYYNKVSLITQDAGIFNDTLSFNLRVANPSATDEMLMKAISLACLDDLYKKLPYGLNTSLGERGLQLSGGERQRLNIARSFLRNFQIVFYDESTSSLDELTAKKVLNNIISYHNDKTIVFITHHEIPLSYCDEVIDLKMDSEPFTG